MSDTDSIRNAFVVAPNGEINERAYDHKWSPVVRSLENLRNDLRRGQERKQGV